MREAREARAHTLCLLLSAWFLPLCSFKYAACSPTHPSETKIRSLKIPSLTFKPWRSVGLGNMWG